MSAGVHSKEPKPFPDWVVIEREYRLGIRSSIAIASEHGITEAAIRKRAKKEGWIRDLNAKVRARADDLVRKAAVRAEVRTTWKAAEAREVEVAATAMTTVRLAQRADIQKARTLVNSLMAELEAQTGDPKLFRDIKQVLLAKDDGAPLTGEERNKVQDAHRKALSLGARVTNMKALAEALRILIALEREAFGIDSSSADVEAGTQSFLEILQNARARVAR